MVADPNICAIGSRWVGNVCEAIPAPVVTVTPIYSSTQTEIETEQNLFSKIFNGITSKIWGRRTKPVLVPTTKISIDWLANEGFNRDNIVCSLAETEINTGIITTIKTWPKGTYRPPEGASIVLEPSSTTKYSVNCSD